jgi:hypothetical protein
VLATHLVRLDHDASRGSAVVEVKPAEHALGRDNDGLEDQQEANCNCYGKCGPGCFSVGSNSYCRKHDCCCRTYGSAACYTWCFVNPKCPAAICQ